MTDSQAKAELKYRLTKYIILSLRDKGVVTQEVAVESIRDLCQKYQPYTYELEVHSLWPNE